MRENQNANARSIGLITMDVDDRAAALRAAIRLHRTNPDDTHPVHIPVEDTGVDIDTSYAEPDYLCEKHEVVHGVEGFNGEECPRCNQEARVQAERQHQITRDRTLEPW